LSDQDRRPLAGEQQLLLLLAQAVRGVVSDWGRKRFDWAAGNRSWRSWYFQVETGGSPRLEGHRFAICVLGELLGRPKDDPPQ
jgi:hypothetical protein